MSTPIQLRKSPLSGGGLPGKLSDCESNDPTICELFLVEDAETNEYLMREYYNAYNAHNDEDDEEPEPVVDANGYIIKKGNKVIWTDPETGKKAKYEVYEEPTEEMVKLWSKYGECEAYPWECRVIEV